MGVSGQLNNNSLIILKKMVKQRYWILLFQVAMTIILYFILQFTYSIKTPEAGTFVTFLESILDLVAYLHIYLYANLFWLLLFIIGIIKKNNELILGSTYSMIFSFGLIGLILSN